MLMEIPKLPKGLPVLFDWVPSLLGFALMGAAILVPLALFDRTLIFLIGIVLSVLVWA